jgi:hypothetical protein
MARTNTQNVTTRRNAVAILAIAPLAAAISVSPAPLSNVENSRRALWSCVATASCACS